MTHIRTQLRNKVQTILKTALSSQNVFVNRTHVLQTSELPGVIITTDREDVTPVTINGTTSDREIELNISVHDKAFDGVDDDLDVLCVTIENAIRNDSTIDAGIELASTGIDIVDGDQQIAVATMSYSAIIYGISDPETVI